MPLRKWSRSFEAQTGWSEKNVGLFLTTPSSRFKGCLRRYFIDGASTLPLEEGNTSVKADGSSLKLDGSPSLALRGVLSELQTISAAIR